MARAKRPAAGTNRPSNAMDGGAWWRVCCRTPRRTPLEETLGEERLAMLQGIPAKTVTVLTACLVRVSG
ncbi:hypothetical protein [Piscinibacterium candidicorallinum]|uniref:Uncharacterized protein n=1 Tax=Piscinibacterium candidicorallinum TaxID=1793872 RepID=A0ABV7H491_9BURK